MCGAPRLGAPGNGPRGLSVSRHSAPPEQRQAIDAAVSRAETDRLAQVVERMGATLGDVQLEARSACERLEAQGDTQRQTAAILDRIETRLNAHDARLVALETNATRDARDNGDRERRVRFLESAWAKGLGVAAAILFILANLSSIASAFGLIGKAVGR